MKWHKHLYVGEGIGERAEKVKWKICHNAGQCSVYVIALASNPQNLLDIIPAQELLQKAYPKRRLYIVGLAKGYEEAIETAAKIVLEVYKNTGGFAVRKYFLCTGVRKERQLRKQDAPHMAGREKSSLLDYDSM